MSKEKKGNKKEEEKILNELLKEIIIQIAGKSAENLTELLNTKKHINEFIIAKKMDLTINQARNLLYKLSEESLVSSIRKKDKKKGWYTYFWKVEILKTLEFLKNFLINQKEQIRNQIKSRETKQFYICERCGIEFNEETALVNNFACNECGEIVKTKDDSKFIKELEKNLEKIERRFSIINKEIEKEQGKIDSVKTKEINRIVKEKAIEKERMKEQRKKERKLSDKKNPKKTKTILNKKIKKTSLKKKIKKRK